MNAALALIRRDLRLSFRLGTDTLMVLAFFSVTVVLFPFGIGPEPGVLARIAGGILFVTALLATLLSLDRMFLSDFDDGSLDILLTSPASPMAIVFAKVVVHWLTTGLPLTILAPFVAVTLNLPSAGQQPLILALLLVTPTLSLVGAVGAALVLGARKGGFLLSLLVLPLYIPILIFGVAVVETAVTGIAVGPALVALIGLLLIAIVLCPWATATALKVALE